MLPEPLYDRDAIRLYHGDCRALLAALPGHSVNAVVTSPPFWGLRMYDCPPSVWGGDPDCRHEEGWVMIARRYQRASVGERSTLEGGSQRPQGDDTPVIIPETASCPLCRAWRGWYGSEPTVPMYIEHTGEVLRALRRVLRPDGALWLDLDDSRGAHGSRFPDRRRKELAVTPGRRAAGIPDMSVCLIPLEVARAARAEGWIVRSVIIIPTWVPESAHDRPTDAYRVLLMLSPAHGITFYWNEQTRRHGPTRPSNQAGLEGEDWRWEKDARGRPVRRSYWHAERYWYDGYVGRVPSTGRQRSERIGGDHDRPSHSRGGPISPSTYRNLGNVWDDIGPAAYPGEHFAVMPMAEAERCIGLSVPPEACPKCGRGRVRIVGSRSPRHEGTDGRGQPDGPGRLAAKRDLLRASGGDPDNPWPDAETLGWTDCDCGAAYEPGVVLDPFAGTGTTLLAAQNLGRRAMGFELSEDYCRQAVTRLTVGDAGVRRMVEAGRAGAQQPSLFEEAGHGR